MTWVGSQIEKKLRIWSDKEIWEKIAIVVIGLFTIAFILISLHRFWQYTPAYYDLGIFDTAVWKLSQGEKPIIDHWDTEIAQQGIFADHIHWGFFALTLPFYALIPMTETLLVLQVVAVALSGWLLYLSAEKVLKNKLSALIIMVIYFLYAGIQNALYTDVHEITFFALPAAWLIYLVVTDNKRWFLPVFIFCLLFKETLFGWGLGMAVLVWFYKKKDARWRQLSIAAAILSVLWYFLSVKLLIPWFKGGEYIYQTPEIENGIQGWLEYIFLPEIKLKSMLLTFLSFGGTIILVPELWVMTALHYAMRFASPAGSRWDLGFHYNAEIAPFLALGMIIAWQRIKSKWGVKVYGIVMSLSLVMAVFLYQWVTKGPLRLAYTRDFYKHTQQFTWIAPVLDKIPPEATVMAQTNLAAHLTHQQQVWFLRDNYTEYKPDYLVIDWREGQSPLYFTGIDDPEDLRARIATDAAYTLVDKVSELEVYRRQ